MITKNVSSLLGLACHYLENDGSVAVIDTPFVFEDGDSIPIYVEEVGDRLRFCDNGELIWHFMGRGVPLDEPASANFMREIVATRGARLNNDGELEVWSDARDAPVGFARYISAVFAMVDWEYEQVALSEERRRHTLAAGTGTEAPLSA